MLQNLLVGAIVSVAAVYSVWALVPGRTRMEWARKLGAWGQARGRPVWIARVTSGIERLAASRQRGCGGCDSAGPAAPREHKTPPD
jgi:hypothetical protein